MLPDAEETERFVVQVQEVSGGGGALVVKVDQQVQEDVVRSEKLL